MEEIYDICGNVKAAKLVTLSVTSKDKNEYLIEIDNKGYFYNTTKYGYKYTYQAIKSFNLLRAKVLASSIKAETKLIKVGN